MLSQSGGLRAWLGRIGYEPAPACEMARAATYLYAAAGTLTLVFLSLPQTAGAYSTVILLLVLASYVAALLFWVGGEHLPHGGFQAMTVFATGLVSAAVWLGGADSAAYCFFYVWIALYAFYFFSQPEAVVHVLLIALLSGAALLAPGPGGSPGIVAPKVLWVGVVGTCLLMGLLVDGLVSRVRAHARTDFLTGAANRRAWDEELGWALDRGRRERSSLFVVLLDLDHFKAFNDEHGHRHGDRFLQQVVADWWRVLRASDLLARYGGEEFAVLLAGCSPEAALGVADRLRATLHAGQTGSAGVAQWDGRESPEALVARADAALYEAKRQGRNRTVNAAEAGSRPDADSLSHTGRWAQPILEVLAGRPMEAVYQPVVRLRDRRLIGHQVLARPAGAPAEVSVEGLFVAAQRMGVIRDLDWICRRAALAGAAGLPPGGRLFLNVSLTTLLDPLHGVEQMLALLAAAGRAPSAVVLEITERESSGNLSRLREVVQTYRDHGFKVGLAQVGQGHSEFEVMATLTPDYIKIASRFTRRSEELGARSAIEAVLAFARATGAQVIAEAVESEGVAQRLATLGVHLGQGFWLGQPLATELTPISQLS
ncbi:MAG: EAL domain-containing protein [Candidatus Dormibacteraceae bacterium]